MTSAAPGVPPAVSADIPGGSGGLAPPSERLPAMTRRLASRIGTLCWVELRKIRHDRTELYTRAIQPALWLLIFGETFTKIHAIPTPGGIPYLDYLAPGILAQSALFIAIFYGIQIIWERDAGVLTKLMVTPTPRAALISGKAFAAGVRVGGPGDGHRGAGGDPRGHADRQPAAAAGHGGRGRARLGVLLVPVDDDRGTGVVQGPADGYRAGDHHAAVLQLERAVPGSG